jgi:hypothetical protein
LDDFHGYDWSQPDTMPRWLRVLFWCVGIAVVSIAAVLLTNGA